MKILVDIGHPAHVHYFRNAIKALQASGHQFLITTRDKEVALDLLKSHGFDYVCTGKNKAGTFKKFLTMFRNDRIIYREAKKFKPDLFLSFFSPFAGQVASFMKIPAIGFTDTETAKLSIKLTLPFTNYVFTPNCFYTDFGDKHFKFNGYMETFYLHPNYFMPDPAVLEELGVQPGETFFIMRFVSFNAGHDAGESGIAENDKLKIAEYLGTKGKLFISSEAELPEKFKKFQLKIPPQSFHSVLAYASLYVGEGATTASECAQLGTPAIYINTLKPGYMIDLEKKELIFNYTNAAEAYGKIKELVETENIKTIFKNRADKMMKEIIDCTAYLVNLVDNFPRSIKELKKNKRDLQAKLVKSN
jgi:uncharacterized protein